jgi:hypothetical protein
MATATVELWVVVDENGDYAIGATQDEAHERYSEDIGAACATRVLNVKLAVPHPKPVEITGTVPEEASPAVELAVA